MSEWFKDWFDTKYYYILYRERNFQEAESFIENLVEHLNLSPGAQILDLACGRGRHSIFLNKLGFSVLGVDLSSCGINHARRYENEKLRFFRGDMRTKWDVAEFDAVFNLYTSVGYFETIQDNLEVFSAVHSYLKTKGVFIIDFMNVTKAIYEMKGTEIKEMGGIFFELTKSYEDGFIIKDIRFEDKGKNYAYQEKVQMLKLADFSDLLLKSGFEIKAVYGDYELANFDESCSDRLIIEAIAK